MGQPRPEPVFPVGFDEDALAEDLERLSEGAAEALDAFRKELRKAGGLQKSRLMACHDEGRDGTVRSSTRASIARSGRRIGDPDKLERDLSGKRTKGDNSFEAIVRIV